jgi:hypothetical protein
MMSFSTRVGVPTATDPHGNSGPGYCGSLARVAPPSCTGRRGSHGHAGFCAFDLGGVPGRPYRGRKIGRS